MDAADEHNPAPIAELATTVGSGAASTAAVVSVREAAVVLGISRAFAYELVARGKLAHLRLGRRIVIPRRAIESMIAEASANEPHRDESAGAPSR
ncbi:MAG: helix-turn-helix domain-containing protein [Actinomycetota bacterium]|nr:helix-turn-helix domain-containing protein [Actinomycetota bacterium]